MQDGEAETRAGTEKGERESVRAADGIEKGGGVRERNGGGMVEGGK